MGRDETEAAEWRDRSLDAITTSHYVGRYGWPARRVDGRERSQAQ